MKQDLKDVTFIIPIRIESKDRMRNVVTVLCYLLSNFETKVILKEVDRESVFKQYVLPQVIEYLDGDVSNLHHIFEESDPDDPPGVTFVFPPVPPAPTTKSKLPVVSEEPVI